MDNYQDKQAETWQSVQRTESRGCLGSNEYIQWLLHTLRVEGPKPKEAKNERTFKYLENNTQARV